MKYEIHPVTGDMWEKYKEIRLNMLAEDPEAFGSSLEAEQVLDDGDWRVWAQESEEGSDRRMFAAVTDRIWVGFGIGSVHNTVPTAGFVWSMWVTKEARRRGIASGILNAIEEWALERGLQKLVLRVNESNRGATKLYERHGFRQNGLREPMRRDPAIVMVEMEKIL